MPEITFDAGMKAEFSDEFAGKLGELNHLLIEAERGGDGAGIADLFRAVHSLKGLAALAGLEGASTIAHQLESVLEGVRSGAMPFTPRVAEAGFAACDHLQLLLDDFIGDGGGATDIAGCLALLQEVAQGAEAARPCDPALVKAGTEPVTKPPSDRSSRSGTDPTRRSRNQEGCILGSAASGTVDFEGAHAPSGSLEMLRVDPARLDVVLNLSSELMIARARLGDQYRELGSLAAGLDLGAWTDDGSAPTAQRSDAAARVRDAVAAIEGLEHTVRTVHRLASTLQGEAMRLRMVPVGPLFRRFERVMRDACRATGHEARLAIAGERTELDKKLADQLVDPFAHLIRNAVDHGLESPAERQQAGKPRRGTVRLEAAHESGRIVIRIADDGRGIDPARLREAIARKGLLPPEEAAALSDREAIDWIFASGFSTAERVTGISGRGVGLDIVRSRIAELSGTVEVESQPGAGTVFVIRLPLTLAMVRSLLVEAGGARYALPLHAVREVVRVDARNLRRVAGTDPHLEVRRELLPMVELRREAVPTPSSGGWAVLARAKDTTVAISVDRVIREEELVVKPLPPDLRSANGASGAAVLGDGGIALFIDIAPLLAHRAAAEVRS